MGDASGRKDKGTLHIDGCAFLSVFLSWLHDIEGQPTAALRRSGLIVSAAQWQVPTGAWL
ncbi:MAG: hypothetical protein KFB97_03270 [Cyanobium sp. M30B3]|nr:MAG: hypothetical protein KFB97_03270 [Cyanobium sp. M30B3]